MAEIPNKLVIGALVVVMVSSLITTFAFFNVDFSQNVTKMPSGSNQGKVSVDIENEETTLQSSKSPAKVSINLKRDNDG